ncbi:MAG: glycosyltransferase family 39 protein [Thermoleophilaceae bacterium]|nr:glycosyltransferase family 39 protein [Thermoleophilaceae bacterium]
MSTVGLRAPGAAADQRDGERGSGSGAPALVVLALLGGLALFVYLYRLGVPTWLGDEVVYRDAGYQYVHGNFDLALENPPVVKYVLGLVGVVFGSGPTAIRAPAAVAGLLTGVVLLLFARREAGLWVGVLAFGLWVLLPRPELVGEFDVGQVKIDRYARQEVFMGLLMAAALLASYRWSQSGRWRGTVLAGVALGLATACKAPAVLVLPAMLACGLVTLRISRRSLLQAATIGATAAATAAATYIPMLGRAPSAIDFMFGASDWRNAIGHPFVFDGTLYQFAPWWANFWWQWKALGTPATIAVVACLVLAPFLLRRGVAVLLMGAALVPAAFLAFGVDYALPYYYFTWQPPLLLLCALVIGALARRGIPLRVAAALIVLPLAVAAVGVVREVARIDTRDYAAVAESFGPGGPAGPVVTWDLDSFTAMRAELPRGDVTFDPRGQEAPAAIIVDPASSDRRSNPTITAYVRANRSDLRELAVDRLLVYVPRSAAARQRLAAASRKAPAVDAGVISISRCLRSRGLDPSVASPSPGTPSQGVKTLLPGGSGANIWVYRTVERAREDGRAIDGFLQRGGGRAVVDGRVVVGYAKEPSSGDAERVEACAGRAARVR